MTITMIQISNLRNILDVEFIIKPLCITAYVYKKKFQNFLQSILKSSKLYINKLIDLLIIN